MFNSYKANNVMYSLVFELYNERNSTTSFKKYEN